MFDNYEPKMADRGEQEFSLYNAEENKPLGESESENEGVQTSSADVGQDPTIQPMVDDSSDTDLNPGESYNKEHQQTKWDKGCLTVLIIFDLILLVLLILVNTLVKEPVPSQPKALQDFCLPCDQVYMGSFEIKEDRFNVCLPNQTEYNKTCCAEPNSDLRMFIQNMYMRVRYQRDRASGEIFGMKERNEPHGPRSCVNYTFPVNRSQEWNRNENSLTYLVQIIKMPESSEENNTLKLEGGAIKIMRRSHYYIFSQVTFLVNEQSQNITQYVFRNRNGTEELLLENTVYPCYFNNNNNFSIPSFVGAMFLFEEGDLVSLHVSNLEKIDSEKSITVGMQCI